MPTRVPQRRLVLSLLALLVQKCVAADSGRAAAGAAPAAAAAGEEAAGRMVWRQGYYLNSVWQRGRYEEMSSAAAALSPSPPGTRFACCASTRVQILTRGN